MSYRLSLRSAAEADIAEAARWYGARQPGLGEAFIDEVDRALVRVLENLFAFPVIYRRRAVRRILTDRFPYRIFFSLLGEYTVVVHAVLHGRRHDRRWRDRL